MRFIMNDYYNPNYIRQDPKPLVLEEEPLTEKEIADKEKARARARERYHADQAKKRAAKAHAEEVRAILKERYPHKGY